MCQFPSHGASGGAASGSVSDLSNRTFVECDGAEPSLWDLSSFRKRRCSATSNAFTCAESSLISFCNRANSARRIWVRPVPIKPMVITVQHRAKSTKCALSRSQSYTADPPLSRTPVSECDVALQLCACKPPQIGGARPVLGRYEAGCSLL